MPRHRQCRYAVRLKNKVMKRGEGEAAGYQRRGELPWDPQEPDTLRYWSTKWDPKDRLDLLRQIREETALAGWRTRLDSGWEGWDMEIYGSRYVKVRLTSATEEHHGLGRLTRVRVELLMSKFCQVLCVASLMLSGLLLLHVWPFSRPAVLIPLVWWAMYLVNKWRVSRPVLGLIDASAEKAGFYPVPSKPAPAQSSAAEATKPHAAATARPAAQPAHGEADDLEDAPSIA